MRSFLIKALKVFRNPFFHGALFLLCAIIMILDVVFTGSNSIGEMTMIGKAAGILFTVDLLAFVSYTFGLSLLPAKKQQLPQDKK